MKSLLLTFTIILAIEYVFAVIAITVSLWWNPEWLMEK